MTTKCIAILTQFNDKERQDLRTMLLNRLNLYGKQQWISIAITIDKPVAACVRQWFCQDTQDEWNQVQSRMVVSLYNQDWSYEQIAELLVDEMNCKHTIIGVFWRQFEQLSELNKPLTCPTALDLPDLDGEIRSEFLTDLAKICDGSQLLLHTISKQIVLSPPSKSSPEQPLRSFRTGSTSFCEMISQNQMYVDKTQILYELVKKPFNGFFLARPRKFGKTLTCSTLEAILEGKRNLFKSLWIGTHSDYKFEAHPVIHISFATINSQNEQTLEAGITDMLDAIAKKYHITLTKPNINHRLFELIYELNEQNQSRVAVIIDEYDKPIIDHICNLNNGKTKRYNATQAMRNRNTLTVLYSVFKDNAMLHFIFLTGTSKVAHTSMIFELNILTDISYNWQYATIAGYTQNEVDDQLNQHVKQYAERNSLTLPETINKLKQWYGGYFFSEQRSISVYNPLDINLCLQQQNKTKTFRKYWVNTGKSKVFGDFLLAGAKIFKQLDLSHQYNIDDFRDCKIDNFSTNMPVMLLEMGYLTFVDYDKSKDKVTLGYPNYEVQHQIESEIVEYYQRSYATQFRDLQQHLKILMLEDEIERFLDQFEQFLNLIDNANKRSEMFYHMILAQLCINCSLFDEEAELTYPIDLFLSGNNKMFIIELKLNLSADEALKQIIDRQYWTVLSEKYDRDFVLVGVNYDTANEKLTTTFKIQNLSQSQRCGAPISISPGKPQTLQNRKTNRVDDDC